MLTTLVASLLWLVGAVLLVALSYNCERCGSAPCKCAAA